MKHIQSKQEFYKYSRALLLGNILTQWSWEEFDNLMFARPDTLPEIVGVRHVRQAFTNKGNSGLMPKKVAHQYGMNTPDKENLLFDEGAVHDRLTIQGEVMATERGLYLRYSHLQCHQRTLWHIDTMGLVGLAKHQLPHNQELLTPAQAAGWERGVVQHAYGLTASHVLRHYMDAPSWECLNNILGCQLGPTNTLGEEFPNFHYPIVEFACFNRAIGMLGWNSLMWEVRSKY